MWRDRFIIFLKHAPLIWRSKCPFMWRFRLIIYLKHAPPPLGETVSSYILNTAPHHTPPHLPIPILDFRDTAKPAPTFHRPAAGLKKMAEPPLPPPFTTTMPVSRVLSGSRGVLPLLAGCRLETNLHGLNKLGGGLTKLTGSLLSVKDCRWCLDACLGGSSSHA